MKEYLLGTFEQCSEYLDELNSQEGYPNPATKTYRFSDITQHYKKPELFFVMLSGGYSQSKKRMLRRAEIKGRLKAKHQAMVVDEDFLKKDKAWQPDPLDNPSLVTKIVSGVKAIFGG